jgi:hypothetical protein
MRVLSREAILQVKCLTRRGYRPGDHAAPYAGPDPFEQSRQRAEAWWAKRPAEEVCPAPTDASQEKGTRLLTRKHRGNFPHLTRSPRHRRSRSCHQFAVGVAPLSRRDGAGRRGSARSVNSRDGVNTGNTPKIRKSSPTTANGGTSTRASRTTSSHTPVTGHRTPAV